MVKPIDIIDEVRDRRDQERGMHRIKGLMIHRCGVDLKTDTVLGYTGREVAYAFTGRNPIWRERVAKYTGYQNPYTFMVNAGVGPWYLDGTVWQCLPIDEIGWHGRRWSDDMIGLAWIGDPRVQPVSEKGYQAMVELAAGLCHLLALSPGSDIWGHGEVDGAHGGGKAPGMPGACPGLSQAGLDQFREDVQIRWETVIDDIDLVISKE